MDDGPVTPLDAGPDLVSDDVVIEGDGSPRRRIRHPSDVVRLVVTLVMIGALLLLELVAADALRTFSIELLALVDGLPDAIADGAVGLVQVAATAFPLVVVGLCAWRRRLDVLAILMAAGLVAALAMVALSGVVEDTVPIAELDFDGVDSWFIGSQYPSATYLAAITAVVVAAGPWLRHRWRVLGWVFVVGLSVTRTVTATEVPLRNGLLLLIGAAAGSLALLVVGAPERRVDPRGVARALASVGLPVRRLRAPDPSDASEPTFVATTATGDELIVDVVGRDQRDADLLLAGWRSATVKGLGEPTAIRSPTGAVRHEALALGLATAAGARAPQVVAVVDTDEDQAATVTAAPVGTPITELAADATSDAALTDVWEQVDALQRRRIAHRRLTGGHLLVDGDAVTLTGWRRADLAATDEVLGADVAELLVTLALSVGPERALASAAEALDAEHLRRAVPLVQRSVCSRATRDRLDALDDEGDELITTLRDGAAARVGIDEVSVTDVRRVTVGGLVSLVGSAVLVWYVLSLAADWDNIYDAFARAELVYVLPILGLSAATYLTGALSLLGAVPIDLRFARTTAVMFGQSFLNRFTPANAGGMAMRIRYLQLEGLDAAVATTSIGLTSAASGVAQGLMIALFLVWGGASDRFSDFEMPDIGGIVVAILLIGLVASAVLFSTWGRTRIAPALHQVLGKVRTMLGEIASDPRKMAQLLGGATLGKLANIAAFWLSAVAFDLDISFPKAGALYIIATTIGSAVPTPGGVGGVDAALTAALLSFGADASTAAAIVLMFRLLTFWLPTIPGYVFLRYTRRAGIV